MSKTILKGGKVIDANASREADVLIMDGIISEVDNSLYVGDDVNVVDVSGLTIMPSFADLHVHLRDPGFLHKETLETGVKAAVNGGYTHIVAMANTKPVADNTEVIADVLARAQKLSLAEVYQASSVSIGEKGEKTVDFRSLRSLTKFFSDDGKNVDSEEIFAEALRASKELDFLIMDHREPETEMVLRNIGLLEKNGGNLHFCHISRADSMMAIMNAKDRGLRVTVEVTPHHLFGYDNDYKVNPPLATKADVDFLIRAIKDGYVDCISTDQAPHTAEDKAAGSPGISGIEVAFSIINTVFLENGIKPEGLSRLMSKNPMIMMGVNSGLLQVGYEANLVVVDENADVVVDSSKFVSMGKNTPFNGAKLKGKVVHTIKKGEFLK